MSFYLNKNLGHRLNIAQAMQIASDQSELGLEQTTPNPCVGSIILDSNDAVVGLGYHKKFGEAHAEVEAFASLAMNKQSLENLSVFVTLEPCAHEGKTPSCAKMLISKNISKVIYLIKDPNSLVSGQGHKILADAGIKTYCVEDILNNKNSSHNDNVIQMIFKYKSNLKKIIKRQKYLNRQFFFSMNSEIPYITLKWAQTLDGTIGLKDNRLKITNQEVQKEVHHLRAIHDILLVGKNTILSDDPLLNNRFGSSRNKSNKIAILDPELEVLNQNEHLKLFSTHPKDHLLFITKDTNETESFENQGYHFIKLPQKSDENLKGYRFDLKDVVRAIKKKYKINSIFVEGGAEVITGFLNEKLFNEVYVFFSLKLSFKKNSIRISYFNWLKHLILNLIRTNFKLFDADFLIYFKE